MEKFESLDHGEEEFKAAEQLLKSKFDELKEKSKEVYGSPFSVEVMTRFEEFKKEVYEVEGEEGVWKVLSYHLMWGSTPDYARIEKVDFEGDLSVEKLWDDLITEMESES